MTHPDDDEWEYNPYFGCMMKKWDPSERFKSACRQYLEFEAMTEQDDPPSAKNLETLIASRIAHAEETFCGLGFTTGKHDPWWKRVCQPHDAHYNALKSGKPDTSNVKAQAEFATGILKGMAEGAWMLLSGPFYLVFGGLIGGTLRYTQLQRRQAAKEGKPWPSNTPED